MPGACRYFETTCCSFIVGSITTRCFNSKVRLTKDEPYKTLCTSSDVKSTTRPNKMHVVQRVEVPPPLSQVTVRYVRLLIHRPATRYGASIWRLQVWGNAYFNS
jgi:hypothetical protein